MTKTKAKKSQWLFLDKSREAAGKASPLEAISQKDNGSDLYFSLYVLTQSDCKLLDLQGTSSCQRVIHQLFPPVGKGGAKSGILYADLGIINRKRQILLLSQKEPIQPQFGNLDTIILPPDYFDAPAYKFVIAICPPAMQKPDVKTAPDTEAAAKWFVRKAPHWGFEVLSGTLKAAGGKKVSLRQNNKEITIHTITLAGSLHVTNKILFVQSIRNGIGEGTALGCGLMRLEPYEV